MHTTRDTCTTCAAPNIRTTAFLARGRPRHPGARRARSNPRSEPIPPPHRIINGAGSEPTPNHSCGAWRPRYTHAATRASVALICCAAGGPCARRRHRPRSDAAGKTARRLPSPSGPTACATFTHLRCAPRRTVPAVSTQAVRAPHYSVIRARMLHGVPTSF